MRIVCGLLAASMILAFIPNQPLWSQEKKTDTTELPGPFHPFNLNGEFEGQFHCLVCEQGLYPGVLVFVRGTEADQLKALLEGLNALAKAETKSRLNVSVIFLDSELAGGLTGTNALDDRREEVANKLRPLQKNWGLDHTVFALEADKNLKDFGLAEKDKVTIILYSKLRIVDRMSFEKLEDKDKDAVLAAAREKLCTKKK